MERVPHDECVGSGRSEWETVHGDLCVRGAPEDCATSAADGRLYCEDSCNGDSGSPLFQDRRMAQESSPPYAAGYSWDETVGAVVFGVVSRGEAQCGRPRGRPAIYTALHRFERFLVSRIPAPPAPLSWPPLAETVAVRPPEEGDIFAGGSARAPPGGGARRPTASGAASAGIDSTIIVFVAAAWLQLLAGRQTGC